MSFSRVRLRAAARSVYRPRMGEITNTTIKRLLDEAAEAGDDEMVRDCRKALQGNAAARRRVERFVDEAFERALWERAQGE